MLLNKSIPLSYIIKKIKLEIVFVVTIGFAVYYLTHIFNKIIPPMPIAIPAFLGTAISVILSFKLNQSYDRWWEARKIWGNIVNDSRTLVLQLQGFLLPGNQHIIRRIAFRHIGWCFSLGRSLRGLAAPETLNNYLSEEDLETIADHKNKPLAILQLNAIEIAELNRREQMDIFSKVQINNTIINLTNAMGMAERIKTTVFPTTYRFFLHGFIYLFVITLSISLSGIETYFEIPLLLVISSAFFLLEKTATHLQDPFSNKPTDTAMTSIATTIEINIRQLINDKSIPVVDQPRDFYVL